MKNRKIRLNILIAIVIVTGLLTSSCVELEAIRKFADNSAAVAEKFPALSNDIYSTCVRRYKYRFYRVVDFDAGKMSQIDELTGTDIKTYKSNLPPEAVEAEVKCRRFKTISPEVIKMNKALALYMKTLGDLAADDLTSYDKGLDDLGSSITDTDMFKETEVKAAISLAKLMSNIFANGYRRKNLKSSIENSNSDVKIMAGALKRYVGENYILELENEQRQLVNYYKANITEHQERVGNSDVLVVTSAKMQMDTEVNRLQERINGANAYVKILDAISDGHQKLYDSRNELNTKETRQTALQSARAIESLVAEIREAF